MPIRVGIKPRSISHGANAGYYAAIFEQSQCTIDGVERDGGNFLSHPSVDCLSIGVFLATSHLPKNLGSLMSCLDTLPTANLKEFLNALIHLFFWYHPKTPIRNDYYLGNIHHVGVACKYFF
jgi:hypothetical protein